MDDRGGHFAERCHLFVIIALGESILVTGTTFDEAGEPPWPPSGSPSSAAGRCGGSTSPAARDASETIAHSEDPGRLARSAYTYFHLPRIAGIIAVAAADELTVAHPRDPGTFASVALTLGGAALFVAGHGAFLWAVSGRVPWSRLVAVVALAALAPVGFAVPALTLAGAAALIVVLLAIGDWATQRRRRPPFRKDPT